MQGHQDGIILENEPLASESVPCSSSSSVLVLWFCVYIGAVGVGEGARLWFLVQLEVKILAYCLSKIIQYFIKLSRFCRDRRNKSFSPGGGIRVAQANNQIGYTFLPFKFPQVDRYF